MTVVCAFERNATICPTLGARRWKWSWSNFPRENLRSQHHELTVDGELSCLVSTRPVFSSLLLCSARYSPRLPFEVGRGVRVGYSRPTCEMRLMLDTEPIIQEEYSIEMSEQH